VTRTAAMSPRALRKLRANARKRAPLLSAWPITRGHVRPSLITPVTALPSERLLDVALQAANGARSVSLDTLIDRIGEAAQAGGPPVGRPAITPPGRQGLHRLPRRPDMWPGEHYKLLAALVALLQPQTVVEIGTATGMSALTMLTELAPGAKIVTFDVVSWRDYRGALLRAEDFADGRLEQRVEDLSIPAGWQANAELLRSADFILVDAKHDGEQERGFVRGFEQVGLACGPIVMFDDIRLWDMLAFWHELQRPKLDITSFGHWSGTGLADWAA